MPRDTVMSAGGGARVGHPVEIGLGTAAVVVALDQAVKALVERVLEPGVFVPWLSPSIGWQLVYNDGGAFNLPAPSLFFLAVTVVVTVIVVRNLARVATGTQAVAYGLLLAGALGNALDRVLRTGDPGDPRYLHGHVVDFVAWGWWPRFNVADAAITCGFVVLAVTLWREERRADRRRDAASDAGGHGRAQTVVGSTRGDG